MKCISISRERRVGVAHAIFCCAYLQRFPRFRDELIDLSSELRLAKSEPIATGAVIDDAGGETAWNAFAAAGKETTALANPFANFRGQAFVSLCNTLRLPRSIVAALRDRLVESLSIPDRLVIAISELIEVPQEALRQYLSQQPTTIGTVEFKAKQKPTNLDRVSFEKLIEDTEMSEDERKSALEYLLDGQPE